MKEYGLNDVPEKEVAAALLKEGQIAWANEQWHSLADRYGLTEAEMIGGGQTVSAAYYGKDFFLRSRVKSGETDMITLISGDTICEELSLQNFIGVFLENMRLILDCVKASIYITDDKANILLINKEAEKTGGMRFYDIIGKNMSKLVDQGFCTESASISVIKTGEEQSIVQKSDDGEQLLLTGVPCFRNGRLELAVTVERDLKEIADLRNKLEYAEEKVQQYEGELEYLRNQELKPVDVICESKEMKNIVAIAVRMAKNDATVLIQGESGSGKEVIADILYQYGSRADKPFVKINCSAIPESLLESELFGYEKGAFTGAGPKGKIGLIELADQGTLFLDEISELSLKLQPKLLRVLQQGDLIRIGGERTIHVDIRVIAASNIDLEEAVSNGTFRKDLYYRLNVVPIKIPPLRDRKDDIIPLAVHFMKRFNEKYACDRKLDFEGSVFLREYQWPGNVRELENIIERVVLTSENDSRIAPQIAKCLRSDNPYIYEINRELPLPDRVAAFERRIIEEMYAQQRSITKTAAQLGVSKSAVCKKMKKYQIGQ